MAANEIKIIIGGDAGGFANAANAAISRIDLLRGRLQKLQAVAANTSDFAKLNKALDLIKKTQAELGTLSRNVPDPFKGVTAGANQAGLALTNLGRVAQDAPFGFIGIQNNINPLLESFQRLKLETGSTGGALKALGSSLIGAGGLGLAVSLVTSALTFMSLSAGGTKEKLEGLAKAMDEANKKAGDELARVQVLNAVITDNTRNQLERTAASKELSGILADLNIKMTQEEILNGNVAKATKLATDAIIERAKARAAEARIGEISGKQLDRDQKMLALSEDLIKQERLLKSVREAQRGATGGGTVPGIGGNTIGLQKNINGIRDSIQKLGEESDKGRKEIEGLINTIKATDLTVDLGGGTEKSKKELDLLKQRIEALKQLQSLTGLTGEQEVQLTQLEVKLAERDSVKAGFTKEELKQQIDGIIEKAFPVATYEFPELLITSIGSVKFEAKPIVDAKALTDGFATDIAEATKNQVIVIPAPKLTFTNLKDSADIARQQLAEVVFNSLVKGIEEGSTVIGEAFANLFSGEGVGSALAKAAQGLLSIVGGILQDVGKQIIVTSTLVKALKAAISKLFGPGGEAIGLAVGAALIATGALLKNIKFNVPKLAEGGIASRATLGIFGEAGREAIIPLDKLPQMMGKLNFANETPVVLQPSIRFSLSDFQIGLERVDNRRRRLG